MTRGRSEGLLPCPYIEEIETDLRINDVLNTGVFLERYGQFADNGQIALQMPQDMADDDPQRWTAACGSLHGTTKQASDYTKLLPEAQWVAPLLRLCEEHSGQKACRTRILTMQPGRCYSYHKDTEKWRYHLVASTHPSSRFLVSETVGNMPVTGGLYRLRTDLMHTAINASKHLSRTHIVICMI